jgi:predicted nucleic acid-binding protein
LSSPLIFDTGALIALFNKAEKETASEINLFLDKNPHSPRLVYEPSLVELFYFLVQKHKVMTPRNVGQNLSALGIELQPVPPEYSIQISQAYFAIDFKCPFDYADFFMCCSALRFADSKILTVDHDDLPLALGEAIKHFSLHGIHHSQIVPFRLAQKK